MESATIITNTKNNKTGAPSITPNADTANKITAGSVKVVVRLLPPSLTKETFLGAVKSEFVQSLTWMHYVQGKRRKTFEKVSSVNSRVYLAFPSTQLADAFCTAVHGHSFIDEKGEVFRAVACYAPYPRIPRCDVLPGKRSNTYESDVMYSQFLNQQKLTVDQEEVSGLTTSTLPNELEKNNNSTTSLPTTTLIDGSIQPVAPLVLAIQEKKRQKQERITQQQEKKRQSREQGKSRKVHSVVLLHKKDLIKHDSTPATINEKPLKTSKKHHHRHSGRKELRKRQQETSSTKESVNSSQRHNTSSATPSVKVLSRSTESKHPVVHILRRPSNSTTNTKTPVPSNDNTNVTHHPSPKTTTLSSTVSTTTSNNGNRNRGGRGTQVVWRPKNLDH